MIPSLVLYYFTKDKDNAYSKIAHKRILKRFLAPTTEERSWSVGLASRRESSGEADGSMQQEL